MSKSKDQYIEQIRQRLAELEEAEEHLREDKARLETMLEDISLRHIAELERLATTDGLTGTLNRRRFLELVESELARYHRYRRPVTFLLLDVDHFSKVNETYGHIVGDEVLKRFAGVVSGQIRKNDLLGRLGGDRWGLLLPETRLHNALELCERILQVCGEMDVPSGDGVVKITVSIGTTEATQANQTVDGLFLRAESALQRAKGKGGNRVEGIYV